MLFAGRGSFEKVRMTLQILRACNLFYDKLIELQLHLRGFIECVPCALENVDQ